MNKLYYNNVDYLEKYIDNIPTHFYKDSIYRDIFSSCAALMLGLYFVFAVGVVTVLLSTRAWDNFSLEVRAVIVGFGVLFAVIINRTILGVIALWIGAKLIKVNNDVVLCIRNKYGFNYSDIKINYELMSYECSLSSKYIRLLINDFGKNFNKEIVSLGPKDKKFEIKLTVPHHIIRNIYENNYTIIKITLSYLNVFTGIKNIRTVYITKKHLINARFSEEVFINHE